MPKDKLEYCLKRLSTTHGFLEIGNWEKKFLENLEMNLQEGKEITESQAERLDSIYDRIINK